jgi:glycosyltransferase involved in cell wall biosynthesis
MLDALMRELSLRDVSFPGFIAESELAEHYTRATVMVFPSHYGFGLSTLEAMACAALRLLWGLRHWMPSSSSPTQAY